MQTSKKGFKLHASGKRNYDNKNAGVHESERLVLSTYEYIDNSHSRL